ncbi:MAG: hypothetical protein ACYSYT_11025, partial [Planctomycetota bacterium]
SRRGLEVYVFFWIERLQEKNAMRKVMPGGQARAEQLSGRGWWGFFFQGRSFFARVLDLS